jgi:hypothetical protein
VAILARIFDAAAVPSVLTRGVLRRALSLASGIADRPEDRIDVLSLMAIANVD